MDKSNYGNVREYRIEMKGQPGDAELLVKFIALRGELVARRGSETVDGHEVVCIDAYDTVETFLDRNEFIQEWEDITEIDDRFDADMTF